MADLDPSLEPLRASAREWHRLQLAALGFVGLCGVLKGDSGAGDPRWLQTLSGVLVLLALVVAVVAILLVALVAWPLSGRPLEQASAVRRVWTGVGLTFVAVALTALSAMSAWWPEGEGGRVRVSGDGGSACGTVVASRDGWIDLAVSGDVVRVPLAGLDSVTPAAGC